MRAVNFLLRDQIKKGIIREQEQEVYSYGYKLLVYQSINVFLSLIIAVLFKSYFVIGVYLCAYIPLRTYAGGYHASKISICTLITSLSLCFISWLILKGYFISQILVILYFIAAVVILVLSPVEDLNKKLDNYEYKKYKSKVHMIWLAESLMIILLKIINFNTASSVIILAHISLAIALVLGQVKNYEHSRKSYTV